MQSRQDRRKKRQLAYKSVLRGTTERPRISLFKSCKNLYVQLIDDEKKITLCAASSLDKNLSLRGKVNKEVAVKIGEVFTQRALEKNIKKVVFDRSGYSYHGVVKELADTCRKNGLEF